VGSWVGQRTRDRRIEAQAAILEAQKERQRLGCSTAEMLFRSTDISDSRASNLADRRITILEEQNQRKISSDGSGKSSLVNAFRGLSNNSLHATPIVTGATETTWLQEGLIIMTWKNDWCMWMKLNQLHVRKSLDEVRSHPLFHILRV
jgi:hypothetical protein